MNHVGRNGILCLGISFLAVTCARKGAGTAWSLRVDGKAVAPARVGLLLGEAAQDGRSLAFLGLRMACAARSAAAFDSATAVRLAGQITLRGSREWHADAALMLLRAAARVKEMADSVRDPDAVLRQADSLFGASVSLRVNDSIIASPLKKTDADSMNRPGAPESTDTLGEQAFVRLIVRLFGISPDAAALTASYLYEEKGGAIDEAMLQKSLRGLIYDPAKDRGNREKKRKARNSALAMRYRSLQSIRDTLARHQTQLQLIYRAHLKRRSSMSGVVWISFLVAPSGEVIEARTTAKSGIRDERFIAALLDYVRTIAFLAIPSSAGEMAFEFPLEFVPEG